ncbi:MAG: hypothetical protein LUE97_02810 [Oscillospiraceae bacterium]|nr:hypothetical protein [Oscillospiraceae bacterium]
MSRTSQIMQTVIFAAFIGAGLLLFLLLPKRDFSQQENRYLASAPSFSFEALASGEFTQDFEEYVTDQFPLRDGWITAKAASELAAGKGQNNGIFLCGGDTLIEPFTAPESAKLDSAVSAVNALCGNIDVPVFLALVPTAAEIWADALPYGAANDSQSEIIAGIYSAVSADTVDICSALAAHADEDIFYRTDHHWTTLGAYYAYAEICAAMGLEPTPLSDYTPRTVTEEFCGTSCSASGFTWVEPDSITVYAEQGGAVITNYSGGEAAAGTLYDESYLTVKDKYSYFYGGNTPLLTIETEVRDAPSILIIRDSYMDSLSPFMLDNFSEIHIVDLRYYRLSIAEYIEGNDIDSVLVCYSLANFCTDTNLFLMGL